MLPLTKKIRFIPRQYLTHGAHQRSIFFRFTYPSLTLLLMLAYLSTQPFQAVAAILGNAAFQFALVGAVRVADRLNPPDLGVLPLRFDG